MQNSSPLPTRSSEDDRTRIAALSLPSFFPTFSVLAKDLFVLSVICIGFLIYFFSFIAYFVPWFGIGIMVLVVGSVFFISYRNLWWGMLIVCFELMIGSLAGAEFSFPFIAEAFTVRKLIWLIIVCVWIVKSIQKKKILPPHFWKPSVIIPIIFVGSALLLGIIRAFMTGVPFVSIYHDGNGYLFFVLLFPLLWALAYEKYTYTEKENQFYRVIGWGSVILSVFSMALVVIATHAGESLFSILYPWLRNTRIAEVGQLGGTSLYRVFIQSQIVLLLVFFVCAIQSFKRGMDIHKTWFLWVAVWGGLIISLSRSFWVGLLLAGGAMAVWFVASRQGWRAVRNVCMQGVTSLGAAFVVLALITTLGLDMFNVLGARSEFTLHEPAVRSRWDLWPALIHKIQENPVFGHGFGSTVTYQTSDPRLREKDIVNYTTYAFEWGYVDIWVKTGVIGFLLFTGALIIIMVQGWKWAQQSSIRMGWWFGMLALLVVHFFTPYLNHPIGIGALIFFSAFVLHDNSFFLANEK